MQPLQIAQSEQDGILTLELVGSVDVGSKELLRERLHELITLGHTQIRIDLGQVEYLGSVGLAVMIEASKRLRKREGRLLVRPGPKEIRKHLALLNLGAVLDFEEPLE